MSVVVVKPAGVGQENKWLLLLVLAIVSVSTLVVLNARPTQSVPEISHGQLDSRDDLNAIEQGLYADLESAVEEIRWQLESGAAMPSVRQLADELIPPFVSDAVSVERGEHQWQLLVSKDTVAAAYLGSTHDPDVAGSFLLRVSTTTDAAQASAEPSSAASDSHSHHQTFSIWYHPESQNPTELGQGRMLSQQLDIDGLKHRQWLQVVSHYNASVTRHGTN